jgi:hypothetical protein
LLKNKGDVNKSSIKNAATESGIFYGELILAVEL